MYEFTKDCMIGISQLDEEHAKLFKILNDAIDMDNYLDDITQVSKDLIDNLRDYAHTHFAHEEAYMEKIHDPELERQKREHQVFASKIEEFELDECTPAESKKVFEEFINYLIKWLYHHILSSDMMIGKIKPSLKDNDMFTFSEKYMTEIELVDNEHRKLFEIIAQTKKVIDDEFMVDKYDQIVNLIEQLKDYTEFHFSDEEKLMDKIAYPEIEAQKRAHAAFIDRLEQIGNADLNEIDADQQGYLVEIIDFLAGWLINHICGMDKKIGVYIKENKIHV
jgi:hemerythrin